jgi:23S rRNA (adenine2503-C2)-methyltransferase
MKKNIKDVELEDLQNIMASLNQPAYRTEQIRQAIFKFKHTSFAQISNLPKKIKDYLEEQFEITSLEIKTVRKSFDGSIKFLFSLKDGNLIESVYMPWYDDTSEVIERETLCISSMSGCSVGCEFCATGKIGFKRNLQASEILEQIFLVEQYLNTKLTNIVFMGMGEPLLNYNNVVQAIEILTDPNYELFSRKKITLSTAGVANKIKQLATTNRPVKLAISLHFTTNILRSKIMPINLSSPLEDLMDAVEIYYKSTKMPITYEYILFAGLNDTDGDVKRLVKIARRVPSKVNIIPFNDISFIQQTNLSKDLKIATKEQIKNFSDKLKENGIVSITRDSFGGDIEAACGQLALSETNISVKIKPIN